MDGTHSMKRWYALHVKPRHEKTVSSALRSKDFEEFLPLRRLRQKWSDRMQLVEMPLLAARRACARSSDSARSPSPWRITRSKRSSG
jgi:hypothetical protein